MINADLTGANLDWTLLRHAILRGTRLDGSTFEHAVFTYTVFEPRSLPDLRALASAQNLGALRYTETRDALVQLSHAFRERGFREQERKVTYALKKTDGYRIRQEIPNDVKRHLIGKLARDISEYSFNRVLFDLPCQYGLNPWRPVRLLGLSYCCFSIAFFVMVHVRRFGALLVVVSRPGKNKERVHRLRFNVAPGRMARNSRKGPQRVVARTLRIHLWWKHSFQHLSWKMVARREWRAVKAGIVFSSRSALNLGFREVDVGRWLRLLTRHQFEMQAVGRIRTVAGIESIVSVYLLALWLLTYFGRPFE
jgi:hypothetical protein